MNTDRLHLYGCGPPSWFPFVHPCSFFHLTYVSGSFPVNPVYSFCRPFFAPLFFLSLVLSSLLLRPFFYFPSYSSSHLLLPPLLNFSSSLSPSHHFAFNPAFVFFAPSPFLYSFLSYCHFLSSHSALFNPPSPVLQSSLPHRRPLLSLPLSYTV